MPPTGPPGIPHAAEVAQARGQATFIWAVGAYCVFMWEWIICLPQEYKRVWTKKITSVSVLYALNRYFGIIQLSFIISLLSGVWSDEACKHGYLWEPVGSLISTLLSQTILGVRVYALFAQNKVVGLILSTILLAQICVGGIAISTTSPPPPVPGPFQPPCGAATGPASWLIAFWAIPLLYDTITFFMTAYKTYEYCQNNVSTPLMSVIWRDGVFYFFAIFSMNVTNVVIFLAAPKGLRAVNLTPTLVLEIVLSCRLLLNMRNTHAKSTTQLNSNMNSRSNTNPLSNINIATNSVKIKDDYLQRNDETPPTPWLYPPGKSDCIDTPSTHLPKLEPNRCILPDKQLSLGVCRECSVRIDMYSDQSYINMYEPSRS